MYSCGSGHSHEELGGEEILTISMTLLFYSLIPALTLLGKFCKVGAISPYLSFLHCPTDENKHVIPFLEILYHLALSFSFHILGFLMSFFKKHHFFLSYSTFLLMLGPSVLSLIVLYFIKEQHWSLYYFPHGARISCFFPLSVVKNWRNKKVIFRKFG